VCHEPPPEADAPLPEEVPGRAPVWVLDIFRQTGAIILSFEVARQFGVRGIFAESDEPMGRAAGGGISSSSSCHPALPRDAIDYSRGPA